MKKQLQQLRRFFVRTKKLNLTATRNALPVSYEEDDEGSSRLSGAFVVVLLLHIVAIVGVFAFTRIRESRGPTTKTADSPNAASATGNKSGVQKSATAAAATSDQHQADSQKSATAAVAAGKTYIVKPGDNLTKIAVAFSAAPADLVSANALKNENDIRAGQVLTIPESKSSKSAPVAEDKSPAKTAPIATASVATKPKTYIVKKGDTVAKIAREHNCGYDELVKLNNIKDPKKIQPGQSVKIPTSKKG